MDSGEPPREQRSSPKPFLYPESDQEMSSVLHLSDEGLTSVFSTTQTKRQAEHSLTSSEPPTASTSSSKVQLFHSEGEDISSPTTRCVGEVKVGNGYDVNEMPVRSDEFATSSTYLKCDNVADDKSSTSENELPQGSRLHFSTETLEVRSPDNKNPSVGSAIQSDEAPNGSQPALDNGISASDNEMQTGFKSKPAGSEGSPNTNTGPENAPKTSLSADSKNGRIMGSDPVVTNVIQAPTGTCPGAPDEVLEYNRQQSQDGHQKAKQRRKRRKSYAWLYNDLSLEDEYNIATVDGEDMDEDTDSERFKPKERKTTSHVIASPTAGPNGQPYVSKQVAGRKPRIPGHYYTEFHLHKWFDNISDTKRRVRSMGFFVVFEPSVIRLTDFKLSNILEEDKKANTEEKSGQKRLPASADESNEESCLPFKKRKRYCGAVTESVPSEPQTSNPSPKPEERSATGSQISSTLTEPQTSSASTEPQTISASVKSQTSSASVKSQTSSASVKYQTSSASVDPQTSSASVYPQTSSASVDPQTNFASVQHQTSSTLTQPQTIFPLTEHQTNSVPTEPQTSLTLTRPQASSSTLSQTSSAPTGPQTSSTFTVSQFSSTLNGYQTSSSSTKPKTVFSLTEHQTSSPSNDPQTSFTSESQTSLKLTGPQTSSASLSQTRFALIQPVGSSEEVRECSASTESQTWSSLTKTQTSLSWTATTSPSMEPQTLSVSTVHQNSCAVTECNSSGSAASDPEQSHGICMSKKCTVSSKCDHRSVLTDSHSCSSSYGGSLSGKESAANGSSHISPITPGKSPQSTDPKSPSIKSPNSYHCSATQMASAASSSLNDASCSHVQPSTSATVSSHGCSQKRKLSEDNCPASKRKTY